jgi:hypothetical protein
MLIWLDCVCGLVAVVTLAMLCLLDMVAPTSSVCFCAIILVVIQVIPVYLMLK